MPDDISFALLTLADDTVVKGTSATMLQDVHLLSVDHLITLRGLTAGEGPIVVGLANEELLVSEILEYLNAAPTSQWDVPAVERANRRVRVLGVFSGLSTDETINDGKPIRTKLNWRLPAGKELPVVWAHNRSGGTLTTGATIQVTRQFWANWKI